MVPLRLLTSLIILSNVSKLVTGTGAENQDQLPCEDEPKSTTTAVPTTTKYPCTGLLGGSTPFKRKNGWWCTKRVSQDWTYNVPFSVKVGHECCETIDMRMMSFEADEEIAAYHGLTLKDPNVAAYWVAASLNSTNGQYYWNDGFAVPTMNPQPNIVDPNGHVAWIVNKDPSVPGYGKFSVVRTDGYSTPNVRAVVCGVPGVN
ncbi:unnamed protein product [Caenorhabditis brenneri]